MRFRRRFSSAIAFISLIRLASMPPYLARHLYSVALLIPCSRQSSVAGTPPSIYRSMPMIWASVNRVVFIEIPSSILPRKFYFRIPLKSGGGAPCNGPLPAQGFTVMRHCGDWLRSVFKPHGSGVVRHPAKPRPDPVTKRVEQTEETVVLG